MYARYILLKFHFFFLLDSSHKTYVLFSGRLLSFVNYGVWRSNPIAAVFFSWLLVQIILFIGSLNLIAQLNSILFLMAYVALNLTCLGLDLTSAPNFRYAFVIYFYCIFYFININYYTLFCVIII